MKENRVAKDKDTKKVVVRSAKECAYLAVFVALVIAMQVALSVVPGVEIVTVMFVTYSFAFGIRRGMLAATIFALLRQIIFGVYPTVLILYLLYFNLLSLCFGWLGKRIKKPFKSLPILVLIACVCTAGFTMLDNIITPLWYGYSQRSAALYFKASRPFMVPQIVCTAVTVTVLFYPLYKVFRSLKISEV